jgi:hypothetical protein
VQRTGAAALLRWRMNVGLASKRHRLRLCGLPARRRGAAIAAMRTGISPLSRLRRRNEEHSASWVAAAHRRSSKPPTPKRNSRLTLCPE